MYRLFSYNYKSRRTDFLVNKFDNRSAATTGWGYLGGSDADSGTGYSSSTIASEGLEVGSWT